MTEPSVLNRLAALPTANIGDAMDRLGILDSRIRPVWPGARVAGRAFTIWTRSGDNALIHQALEVVGAGDVIVVNGGGDESRALIGELIGQRAKNSGVAGFVIDGAVRDAEGLGEMGMPVFARAVTPAGPYKNGPGHLGRTIAVGGVAVAPGDLILGDADGVVVVPLAEAERVAQAAEAVFSLEEGKRAAILGSE
ncbi:MULTISPECIES: methyltransferase [unclassified Nonomuraea]|uniref:RraA family protein n=1 Tax=unclassified Nonomuraea TaxID=2593643 RepID=UPI0033D77BC8